MKKIVKLLTNSLLVIALLSGFAMGETTVSYNFKTGGAGDGYAVNGLNKAFPGIALDANIGFGSFKNSSTNNPTLSNYQLRLDRNATKGGSIKIYANNGVTITEVIVHASEFYGTGTGTGPAAYTVDGGTTAIDLLAGGTYTMSGLSANLVEFYQKDDDMVNSIYVDKFDVTYTKAGASPITLASFTAKAKAGVVELAWETASETNNAQFILFRNDEELARIEGAGTTSETNNYVYLDETVVPGVAYTYVLADVDYAGDMNRYNDDAVTITLDNSVAEADFVIGAAYPNPFNPTALVPLKLSRDAFVEAKIYSITGREISTLVKETMTAGSHELQINARDMTTGLYLVRVTIGDVVNVQKVAYLK